MVISVISLCPKIFSFITSRLIIKICIGYIIYDTFKLQYIIYDRSKLKIMIYHNFSKKIMVYHLWYPNYDRSFMIHPNYYYDQTSFYLFLSYELYVRVRIIIYITMITSCIIWLLCHLRIGWNFGISFCLQ